MRFKDLVRVLGNYLEYDLYINGGVAFLNGSYRHLLDSCELLPNYRVVTLNINDDRLVIKIKG